MFHPMTTPVHPARLPIHALSGVALAAGRFRAVAAGLDPQLRVGRLQSLDDIYWQERSGEHTLGFMLGAAVVIVLLVPVSAALMIVIGLLAVVGPARRAIRIDSTEALRVSSDAIGRVCGRSALTDAPLMVPLAFGSSSKLKGWQAT
jgi:hypothetical protein